MYAHLYKDRIGWELIITPGRDLMGVIRRVSVSGKYEAKRLAREYGATPWNF